MKELKPVKVLDISKSEERAGYGEAS